MLFALGKASCLVSSNILLIAAYVCSFQKDALKRKPVGSISISEQTDVQFLNSSDLTSEEVKCTESR